MTRAHAVSMLSAFVAAFVAAVVLTAATPWRPGTGAQVKNPPVWALAGSGLPNYRVYSEAEMEDLLKSGDRAAIRDHAWKLFSAIVDQFPEEGEPAWAYWTPKCDIFGNGPSCPPDEALTSSGRKQPAAMKASEARKLEFLRALRTPQQLIGVRASADAASDSQFAEVLYNPAAKEAIQAIVECGGQSTIQQTLDAAVSNAPTSCGGKPVADFPASLFPTDAMVVKTIWELVADAGQDVNGVVVWDPDKRTLLQGGHNQLDRLENWKSTITLGISGDPCDAKGDYQPDSSGKERVPISCFYSIDITDDEAALLMGTPHPRQGGVGVIQGGGGSPYKLILLGFHLMTREATNWTWQTYYWSNQAYSSDGQCTPQRDCSLRDGVPAGVPQSGVWRHYVMNTTLSATGTTTDLKPPMNPYVEGVQSNGLTTNCVMCHSEARYHSAALSDSNKVHADGYCLGSGSQGCSASAEEYAQHSIGVSFLWSLADLNFDVMGGSHFEKVKGLIQGKSLAEVLRSRAATTKGQGTRTRRRRAQGS